MEYSLTVVKKLASGAAMRLNPYSNGILSDAFNLPDGSCTNCLNPYSNGILSDSRPRGYRL